MGNALLRKYAKPLIRVVFPREYRRYIRDYVAFTIAERKDSISMVKAHIDSSELEIRRRELVVKYKKDVYKGVVFLAGGVGLFVLDTLLTSDTKGVAQNLAEIVNSFDYEKLIEKGLEVFHYVIFPLKYVLSLGGLFYAADRWVCWHSLEERMIYQETEKQLKDSPPPPTRN